MKKNKINISILVVLIILVILCVISMYFIFVNNKRDFKESIEKINSKAYTTTIGSGTFITEADHNSELLSQSSDKKTVVYLGTGTSFDVTKYSGYQSFTSDNFIVSAISCYGNIAGTTVNSSVNTGNSATISKIYNASTGIFSIGGTSATFADGDWSTGGTNRLIGHGGVNVAAYLIY